MKIVKLTNHQTNRPLDGRHQDSRTTFFDSNRRQTNDLTVRFAHITLTFCEFFLSVGEITFLLPFTLPLLLEELADPILKYIRFSTTTKC